MCTLTLNYGVDTQKKAFRGNFFDTMQQIVPTGKTIQIGMEMQADAL